MAKVKAPRNKHHNNSPVNYAVDLLGEHGFKVRTIAFCLYLEDARFIAESIRQRRHGMRIEIREMPTGEKVNLYY